MNKAVFIFLVIMAIAGSTGAWANADKQVRCGVNLGSSEQEERESSKKKDKYSDYERSLAGPSLEKLELMTEAAAFKTPATQGLLPETFTVANMGCVLRF